MLTNCASVMPDIGTCHRAVGVVDTYLLCSLDGRHHDSDFWPNVLYIKLVLTWEKFAGRAQTVLVWLRVGQVARVCEGENGPSGSLKCGKFLD